MTSEHGFNPTDSLALSPDQVARVAELHRRTVEEEREVTEKTGEQHESVELDEGRA
ncbi:hypothetical protein ACET3Z_009155 [Daucus carota]